MEISIYTFEQLNTQMLYQLLRLRSEVFVVEQNCVYQDIDNKDLKAHHVLGTLKGELLAYTRFFAPGDYVENASLGRVVVHPDHRGKKLGEQILQDTLNEIKKRFGKISIEISAQTYLTQFYFDFGFRAIGEEYLEDGIPHIKMLRKPAKS